jgi:hypothetical protein
MKSSKLITWGASASAISEIIDSIVDREKYYLRKIIDIGSKPNYEDSGSCNEGGCFLIGQKEGNLINSRYLVGSEIYSTRFVTNNFFYLFGLKDSFNLGDLVPRGFGFQPDKSYNYNLEMRSEFDGWETYKDKFGIRRGKTVLEGNYNFDEDPLLRYVWDFIMNPFSPDELQSI